MTITIHLRMKRYLDLIENDAQTPRSTDQEKTGAGHAHHHQGLSKVYSKVHTLSLYCDKNLLSASVICRAPLLWGPWRITRQGLVTGSWAGSSADPPSSDARVTWIRVWPGSPGQPPPAPSDFPAQQRLPPRWGEREENDLKLFIANQLIIKIICS